MNGKQWLKALFVVALVALMCVLVDLDSPRHLSFPLSTVTAPKKVVTDSAAPSRIDFQSTAMAARIEADSVLHKIFERQKQVFKNGWGYEYNIGAFSDLIPTNALNVYSIESERGGFISHQEFVAMSISQWGKFSINAKGEFKEWNLDRLVFVPE